MPGVDRLAIWCGQSERCDLILGETEGLAVVDIPPEESADFMCVEGESLDGRSEQDSKKNCIQAHGTGEADGDLA